ncbi:aprataxin and PNK-like factor [Symsagittifera roscoffensis]|uniref:aprataxin and PNK-like factor n=1 Tax=Symsagittifera roscoffensis TaxID=84072 RepID=UPI00307C51FB
MDGSEAFLVNVATGKEISLTDLKPGVELVLGRGTMLDIEDPRVSRSHALIRLTEASVVEIKPVAKNPMYYFEATDEIDLFKRRIMTKNVFTPIRHGDRISFLSEVLIFELYHPSEVRTDESFDGKTADNDNDSSENDGVIVPLVPDSLNDDKKTSDCSEISPCKIVGDSQPNELQSASIAEAPEIQSPRKRMSNEGNEASSSKKRDSHEVENSLHAHISRASVTFSPDVFTSTRLSAGPDLNDTPPQNRIERFDIDDGSRANDISMLIRKSLRKKCVYAGSCYRSCREHKKQYCHPGDSDYLESDEEDATTGRDESSSSINISKPKCPYGKKCYRRNAAHRAHYCHEDLENTSIANSSAADHSNNNARRSRLNVRSEQELDDMIDQTYDYDDSFIDDGSDLEEESEDYSEEEESNDSNGVSSAESDHSSRPLNDENKTQGTKKPARNAGFRRVMIETSEDEDS